MSKMTIPITLWNHPRQSPVGKVELEEIAGLDPRIHRLEMGYMKNDDGTVTLVEISICPLERVSDSKDEQ